MLLSRLNLVEGGFGEDDVAYAPVAVPLLEILRDTDQHEAVKIAAVVGLRRILLYGRPARDLKNNIALELISQLQTKASIFWYPMRLVQALGCIDEPLITKIDPAGGIPQQQPLHVHELVTVMRDDGQHWIVRSKAARALGRVSLHPSVDTSLLSYEIVVYCSQMAGGYNKNPKGGYWPQCFFDVYLAFKPLDEQDRLRVQQVKPATLISKFDAQRAISDAYDKTLPMARHVLQQPQVVGGVRTNQPIPDADVQSLTAWISENKPSGDRLAPGLPLLEQTRPTAAKSDNSGPSPVLASDEADGPN